MSHQPDFERARQYALDRLSNELPATLRYHTLEHTVDGVLPAVEQLAALSNVGDEDLLLLRTAAYFHDLGFIVHPSDHEQTGVRIAGEVLPGYGYQPEQVQVIAGLILATKLPQAPHTLLEQILADADLSVLGSNDFLEWNHELRAELETAGRIMTDQQWYDSQIRFLSEHRYWTAAAHTLCNDCKQKNLQDLRALAAQYNPLQQNR